MEKRTEKHCEKMHAHECFCYQSGRVYYVLEHDTDLAAPFYTQGQAVQNKGIDQQCNSDPVKFPAYVFHLLFLKNV